MMYFPRAYQNFDYIRLKSPFSGTNQISVCANVTFTGNGYLPGTLISYATLTNPREFAIFPYTVYFGRTSFRPGRYGKRNKAQQHVCMVVDSGATVMTLHIYVNGKVKFDTFLYVSSTSLSSGGYFVIGQDQDRVLSGFDSSQSYTGNINNMAIWNRALSAEEVSSTYRQCACATDALIIPTEKNVQLYQAASLKSDNSCF